jgi:hypothetical protein
VGRGSLVNLIKSSRRITADPDSWQERQNRVPDPRGTQWSPVFCLRGRIGTEVFGVRVDFGQNRGLPPAGTNLQVESFSC